MTSTCPTHRRRCREVRIGRVRGHDGRVARERRVILRVDPAAHHEVREDISRMRTNEAHEPVSLVCTCYSPHPVAIFHFISGNRILPISVVRFSKLTCLEHDA